MKCPLMFAGDTSPGLSYDTNQCECIKEECAWWDDRFSQCVDVTTAEQLLKLANALKRIDSKIPLGILK